MLRTEPSFCIYNNEGGVEEVLLGSEDSEGEELVKKDGISSLGSREFSFGKSPLPLIEEEGKEEALSEFKELGIEDEAVSYLLPNDAGLGSCDDGFGSGKLGFGENDDVEEFCERRIREDPSNPLFLRNYALLLQSKGDLCGAEDFYHRATLADPKDGEILLQYAKLVWALRHDKEKALMYFKRAARAAPEESHILAAYASFLWEIDEDEEGSSSSDEDGQVEQFGCQVDHCDTVFVDEKRPASPPLYLATGLGVDLSGFSGAIGSQDFMAADYGDSSNVEDNYKMMIEETPPNPSIIKNYEQFLDETGGDLQAAEEYYLHAIQVDPTDGKIIIQYAQAIWKLYSDRHKALPYFDQAVRASPDNSNVLAAYARFLWEAEDDDEEEDIISNVAAPAPQGAGTDANA